MTANWFGKFLRNRDSFGHTIQLVYKGQGTYNSVIGGVLTLLVQVLTLVMIIQAMQDLFLMKDPMITNFEKHLTKEEQ